MNPSHTQSSCKKVKLVLVGRIYRALWPSIAVLHTGGVGMRIVCCARLAWLLPPRSALHILGSRSLYLFIAKVSNTISFFILRSNPLTIYEVHSTNGAQNAKKTSYGLAIPASYQSRVVRMRPSPVDTSPVSRLRGEPAP